MISSQEGTSLIETSRTTKPERDFESDFSGPTDRESVGQSTDFERMSTEELRELMFHAARSGAPREFRAARLELQRRRTQALKDEAAVREHEQLAAERAVAEATARGNRCELTPQGCRCRGYFGTEHERFVRELRKPAISAETQAAVAGLLGYPPKSARLRHIFAGARGGGTLMSGFEWAYGALEEDWLEVIEIAGRAPGQSGAPSRNHRDGSVKEGWVRSVLASVIARRTGSVGGRKGQLP